MLSKGVEKVVEKIKRLSFDITDNTRRNISHPTLKSKRINWRFISYVTGKKDLKNV